MKIVADKEDIFDGSLYRMNDKDDFKDMFIKCLPSNDKGLYAVSNNGHDFGFVPGHELWDYPIVKINFYYCEHDEDDDEEYVEFRDYVNTQGIGLLAFDISERIEEEGQLRFRGHPSFISAWKGKVQIIYKLKNFIPATANERTWRKLDWTQGNVPGQPTGNLINPLCNEVESSIIMSVGMSLDEILEASRILKTLDHIKSVRGKAGRKAAEVRAIKSKRLIKEAVESFKLKGITPTQSGVAKICGLSRKTVGRWWAEVG